jgi:hypothetical protein
LLQLTSRYFGKRPWGDDFHLKESVTPGMWCGGTTSGPCRCWLVLCDPSAQPFSIVFVSGLAFHIR